jgi:hypothetical protein
MWNEIFFKNILKSKHVCLLLPLLLQDRLPRRRHATPLPADVHPLVHQALDPPHAVPLQQSLSPIVVVFLMNLNLLVLAERSWRVQFITMHVWHPVVQTFFCVTRVIHGAAVILSVVLWGKLAQLAVVGWIPQ